VLFLYVNVYVSDNDLANKLHISNYSKKPI